MTEKKKELKITTISFEQYSDYEFIDPATFFIVDAMQNYVYIHTSKRDVAQDWVDDNYGKNRYTVKASKLQKTKSRQENGGISVRGKQFTKGQKKMIGLRVGFLTVIEESQERLRRNKLWLCECDCGVKILVSSRSLKLSEKKSCGCKSKAETQGTHGMYGTPTHNSWRTMKDRCLSPSHKSYEYYKEIPIDPEWIISFEAFYKDMGDRPEGKTLDRINNSLGYFKENCRWATLYEQQQNRKPNYINKNKGLAGVGKSGDKFMATIGYNGIKEYLGTFDTPEQANEAYNKRGFEIFGDNWVYKGPPQKK